MTSYLTSIDTFFLSRTFFEIFDFKIFWVWPWPLTFRGHLGSKIFSPFESPYMTSYLTSIDTFFLSRTVFEIFDFKVFWVWPWPLTFEGHLGSKIFSSFESPYMTSYLTSTDTFSLSHTVFEIFDFEVSRVWPWPLTFGGHLGSKIFSPFESSYMTSYLTSIDTFSLSRTVSRKFGSKFSVSNKMADFDLFKVKVFNRLFHFKKRAWLSPNGVEWRIARQNRFSRFGCTLIKERILNIILRKVLTRRTRTRRRRTWIVTLKTLKYFVISPKTESRTT